MKYTNLKIESKKWINLIIKESNLLGVIVTGSQVNNIRIYAKELLRWNKVFNLTSIINPIDVAVKHFLDSLAVVPFIGENTKILDIGSGAGFPGLPLKILLQNSSITLMEASRKKTSFLKYISQKLGLNNVSVVHGHCEHLTDPSPYKEMFDVVICRALTDLPNFIRIALPFISKRGSMIALKGKINQANLTIDGIKLNTKISFSNSFFLVTNHSYKLPILGSSRNIVFIRHCDNS